MADRKRSRNEEREFAQMIAELEAQETDIERLRLSRRLVPEGWHALEARAPVTPAKTKLTLTLDADLVAWFRRLGRGYQPRMNAVLRAYMHAVLAKEVERTGDRDWQDRPI